MYIKLVAETQKVVNGPEFSFFTESNFGSSKENYGEKKRRTQRNVNEEARKTERVRGKKNNQSQSIIIQKRKKKILKLL